MPGGTSSKALALLLSGQGVAHAGAQYLGDNPSQGGQRAGAFVAKADDATAIYYNPGALLVGRARHELFVGLSLLQYVQTFDRAGNYPMEPGDGVQPPYAGQPYPKVTQSAGLQTIPFLAAVHRFGNWAIAEGLFTPHSYPKRRFPPGVRLPGNVPAPAPQRYDMTVQDSKVVYPSVAAAFRATPRLGLGLRVSFGVATIDSVRSSWGVANTAEDPGFDSGFTIAVQDSFAPQVGLGAHYRASDAVEIGVSYTSTTHVRAKGEGRAAFGSKLAALSPDGLSPADPANVRCAPGGTKDALKTCVNLNLPQTATAGVRWIQRDKSGREKGDVEIDVRWENWGGAGDYQVIIDAKSVLGALPEQRVRHGYQDTWGVRAGASRRFVVEEGTVELRGGLGWESASAPTSWTRLDVDTASRTTLAAGVAYEFDRLRVDIGGMYVVSPDQSVVDVPLADPTNVPSRVQPDPSQAVPPDQSVFYPINAGQYATHHLVGSIGLTASF